MSPSLNFIVSAPGKVILFGEHSVLYAQPALATSIDKRTTLKFQSNVNDVILESKNIDFKLQISPTKVNIILENIASTYKSNGDQVITEGICDRNLVEGIVENVHTLSEYTSFNVAQRLSLQCVFYLLYALFYAEKKDIGAFKIEIISELVTGAGTGSSASFSVCLAAALIRYREFITGPNNTFKASAEFTDEQKSLINKWAFVCEQIIHGKASGVDNFVCTYGSMVNISFGDGSSKNIKADFKLLPNTARLRVLLVNSGVNRNTAMMVKRVSELHERNQPVTELVFMTIGEITKIAAQLLKELKNVEFDEKSDEYAKLFARLEDLVSINHGLLTSLGVSHPTLNKIIEISSQFGLKSKLTGAGGGGYVFVLVPPFYPEFKLTECKKSLEAAGFNVADATVGGKGLDIR